MLRVVDMLFVIAVDLRAAVEMLCFIVILMCFILLFSVQIIEEEVVLEMDRARAEMKAEGDECLLIECLRDG